MSLGFTSERHSTVAKRTDFSLLGASRPFRENPPVDDGNLRAIRVDLRVGDEPSPFDLLGGNRMEVSVEHATPSIARSDFTFTRYSGVASATIPTIGRGLLFRPNLRLRLAAGASAGTLPPQRFFDLESGYSGEGPFGVLRGAGVKEFGGAGYISISAEHNFRTLPFLALGIPFLYENSIELVVHGAAGRSWGKNGVPSNTTGGWYYEAGFGVSRILDLFRVDFTWRLAEPTNVLLSFGVAQLL
jgi:hypothetical protein